MGNPGAIAGAAKQQSAAVMRHRRLLLTVLVVAIVTFTTGVFVLLQRSFDSRISLATGVAGGMALLCGVFFAVLFTRAMAQGDRQLAEHASDLEKRILERTAELDHINRGMRLVLDNVQQGFVTVSLSGVMSFERSAIVDRWLGEARLEANLCDVIRPHDPEAAEWMELGLAALQDGTLPLELLLAQLPRRMALGERTLRLGYTPIMGTAGAMQLLVILTDVTDEDRARAGGARQPRDEPDVPAGRQRPGRLRALLLRGHRPGGPDCRR